MPSRIEVPAFEKEDFIHTTKPYEWLMQYSETPFLYEQATQLLRVQAESVKLKGFTKLLNSYITTVKKTKEVVLNNATAFSNQPLELLLPPEWEATDAGVFTVIPGKGVVSACNHPIMPVQRLVNIDSEIGKIKLAYCRRGGVWRYITVDKKAIASRQSIVQLSEFDIAVNSENAGPLVRYLTDAESYNIDVIPEINSVGRLGWIGEHGFSPYVEQLVFDGDLSFKHIFDSVKKHGKYEKWLECASKARNHDIITRIILAGAFASVLVGPCDALPFFVHIWGGTEAGKTVGLMLAASVWANPEQGAYWHTFNSTAVGQELTAGFLNSLPLIIDELQILSDRKDFDKLIYTLSEGVGRARGSKNGGLQKVWSWHNCILTSGEMPITNASSGGGAVNRIIEIDCKGHKLFSDPVTTVATIKKNYGFAGEIFIEKLQDSENYAMAINMQKEYYRELCQGESTEKQAMAGSLLLTADRLISEWIFKDNSYMGPKDIEPFLQTKQAVSINDRAYDFIVDYVNIHSIKFENAMNGDYTGEIWGTFGKGEVFIIKTIFDKIMLSEGYNPTAFLSWAKEAGLIRVSGSSASKGSKRNTIMKRFNISTVNNCVCLKLPQREDETNDNFEETDGDIPF